MNIQNLFALLFLIFAIRTQDTQQATQADASLKNEEPQPQLKMQEVEPIAIDPIVVNPSLKNQQNAQNIPVQENKPDAQQIKTQPDQINPEVVNIQGNPTVQEPIGVDKSSGQLKIQDQPNINQIQTNSQNQNIDPNPDPRKSRTVNPNAQADLKAAEQQRLQRQRVQKQREEALRQAAQIKQQQARIQSQKYKAEQQRLKEIRERQQAYEQKRKKELQLNTKEEYSQDNGQQAISQSQRARMNEITAMRQTLKNFYNISLKTMLFEIYNSEEFLLRPSTDMNMVLRFTIYVETNNVYGFVTDVAKTSPINFVVYEDNRIKVGQLSCFYEGAINFEAKANKVYTLRAINTRQKKLISFSYPSFVNSQTADKLASTQKTGIQLVNAKNTFGELSRTMNQLQEARMLDIRNVAYLDQSMRRYYSYHIIQMAVFVAICILQMLLIKKMFKNKSIL